MPYRCYRSSPYSRKRMMQMAIKTRTIETLRFHAATNDDETFTIIELTEQSGIDPLGSRETQWRDERKSYETMSGGAVQKVSDTEYRLLSGGKIAKKL